jgi:hypothetical protein
VKWQKQIFPGIQIDTSQPPIVFKTQLYTLTGVPPERQKIMVKGGILKVEYFGDMLLRSWTELIFVVHDIFDVVVYNHLCSPHNAG